MPKRRFTLLISEADHRAATADAERRGLSLSAYIRVLILEERERKEKKR